MGWNYLSIPKLQLHLTLYQACNYLSMLRLKLNHVSKRGHWKLTTLHYWHYENISFFPGGKIVHTSLHKVTSTMFWRNIVDLISFKFEHMSQHTSTNFHGNICIWITSNMLQLVLMSNIGEAECQTTRLTARLEPVWPRPTEKVTIAYK